MCKDRSFNIIDKTEKGKIYIIVRDVIITNRDIMNVIYNNFFLRCHLH